MASVAKPFDASDPAVGDLDARLAATMLAIANVGHDILPDVPPIHARAFVDAVKEWRWTNEARTHSGSHAQLAGIS